jgi:hypothetical protein
MIVPHTHLHLSVGAKSETERKYETARFITE